MNTPDVPRRPLQLRRAWRTLRQLLDEAGKDLDTAFQLLEALGGPGDAQTWRLFLAEPGAAELLARKPSLAEAMADRTALAALPDDSFGRAYLDFAVRNGIEVEGLLEANHRVFEDAPLHPDHAWFFDRINAMHDLWHVLSGYGTDEGGETALLSLSRGVGIRSRGISVLVWTSMIMAPKSDGFRVQRYLRAARLRGVRASNLLSAHYESLLPLPLAEVRRRLCIDSVQQAHPDGLIEFRIIERDESPLVPTA